MPMSFQKTGLLSLEDGAIKLKCSTNYCDSGKSKALNTQLSISRTNGDEKLRFDDKATALCLIRLP